MVRGRPEVPISRFYLGLLKHDALAEHRCPQGAAGLAAAGITRSPNGGDRLVMPITADNENKSSAA